MTGKDTLKVVSSLEQIILNSDYRVLNWFGQADGGNLSQNFDNSLIQDKKMLIKSVKLIPYANGQMDVFWNSTTGDRFSVPALFKLINVIDTTSLGTRIVITVNGAVLQLFPLDQASEGYPADLFVDNIYHHYKQYIDTMTVAITTQTARDLSSGSTDFPFIKVLIECYLY